MSDTGSVSAGDTSTWQDRYAMMMMVSHDAIAKHYTTPAMIYASIDQACPWAARGGGCALWGCSRLPQRPAACAAGVQSRTLTWPCCWQQPALVSS